MPPPVTSHKASELPPWAGTWLPAGDLVLDGGQDATVSFDRDGRCRLLLALDRPAEVEDVTALEEAADALPYLHLNDLEGGAGYPARHAEVFALPEPLPSFAFNSSARVGRACRGRGGARGGAARGGGAWGGWGAAGGNRRARGHARADCARARLRGVRGRLRRADVGAAPALRHLRLRRRHLRPGHLVAVSPPSPVRDRPGPQPVRRTRFLHPDPGRAAVPALGGPSAAAPAPGDRPGPASLGRLPARHQASRQPRRRARGRHRLPRVPRHAVGADLAVPS